MRHLVGADLLLGRELRVLQLPRLPDATLELLLVYELLHVLVLETSFSLFVPVPVAPIFLIYWSYGNLVLQPGLKV